MKKIINILYFILIVSIIPIQSSAKYSDEPIISGNLTGPDNVCGKGTPTQYTYEARSCYNGHYRWTCNNCQIKDNQGNWVTTWQSTFTESGGTRYIRFLNSTGSTATINVLGVDPRPCNKQWNKTVTLGPPSTTGGNVNGDSQLMNCGNYYNTYTFSGAINGWEFSYWSAGSGLTIVSSSGSTVNIKPSSSSTSGTKTLKAVLKWRDVSGELCDTKFVSKSITVISPYLTISGQSQICPGGLYQYYARFNGATEPVPGATYYWTYPSGYTALGGNTGWSLNLQAPLFNPQGGGVNITSTLPCGGPYTNSITIYPYCPGGGYAYSVSPNPAYSDLSIQIKVIENQVSLFEHTEVETVELVLLDRTGKILLKEKLKTNNQKVDIRSLKANTYYTKLLVNGEEIGKTKRIVKK